MTTKEEFSFLIKINNDFTTNFIFYMAVAFSRMLILSVPNTVQ